MSKIVTCNTKYIELIDKYNNTQVIINVRVLNNYVAKFFLCNNIT